MFYARKGYFVIKLTLQIESFLIEREENRQEVLK